MKIIVFLIAAMMACGTACAQEKETYMLRPHEKLPVADTAGFTKIFLAGTIDMGNSRDWQAELLIIMYIIGSSKSPITLLEMGLHARSGKLIVACEPDFYRYDNVRITCAYYGIPLYSSLEELLKASGL